MLKIFCDTCDAMKMADDVWLLGLAAETLGVTQSRREVSVLPVWDANQALHPLAVHFCSTECKDDYLATLFGEEAATGAAVKTATSRRKPPRALRKGASKVRRRSA